MYWQEVYLYAEENVLQNLGYDTPLVTDADAEGGVQIHTVDCAASERLGCNIWSSAKATPKYTRSLSFDPQLWNSFLHFKEPEHIKLTKKLSATVFKVKRVRLTPLSTPLFF
jgi:hypothetical protein